MLVLSGGRVFTGNHLLENHTVIIDGGLVKAIEPAQKLAASGLPDRPLHGALLAPGFIDIQVNGGGGAMFNDQPSLECIKTIAAAHRRFGTTGLLPTLISSDWQTMIAARDAAAQAIAAAVPGVLGIHFEGPYLNPARRGMHDASAIRGSDENVGDVLTSLPGARILTIAPECVPDGFISRLAEQGVLVLAGHTEASYRRLRRALQEGLRGFVHLFNAMSPLGSREPGAVGCALDDADSWCGIIVDGEHVHPASLRIALRAKAAGKVLLVTDAMATVGSNISAFRYAGQVIRRMDNRLINEAGVLAGSNLDMAQSVRNCIQLLELELAEALRMASLYPAQFLGLGKELGRIAPGYRASMVLLDDDLNVLATWIDGRDDSGKKY